MNGKHLLISALAIAATMTVRGEDTGFDLDSQRGEVQEYYAVPGQKLDHHGIIINPTPQSITRPYTGRLNISGGFKVKDVKKKFADNLGFLAQNPKGVQLDITFGTKEARKAGVKDVEGAYMLEIGPKKITITGYDEAGAFYGLQTLRQILESPDTDTSVQMMTVNDFPSMKYRGVVEGFYGTPWSHKVRVSLIDFYGRNKLNDYLYGPKDDPYHSSPYWRQPYPEDQAQNIKELVDAAKRNRVNFIWAIHPGKDIRWNKADYDSLVNKFNMMYDLGVRSFAIFFDDIEGEGTDPHKQAALLNDLTEDFVKTKGDVTNLIVCPTDYSQLWAKPGPDGPLAVYGRNLNKDVEVFWTGAVVCSDLTHETLDFVNQRIKRPALYWWNYPVTDYCKHIIMQGPVYGLATDLTAAEVAGIESNPMEHGEASKLALYGVADYAWNTPAYNPIDNWERGLVELMPDAAEAYRTFAIHSTDTETGYRRDESWETETFQFDNYTPAQYDKLYKEFTDVRDAESRILASNANPALVAELKPWLTEFTKLGERGIRTLDLMKTYEAGNDSAFWEAYSANLMSHDDRTAYEAHRSGTMKLQPFYETNMDAMVGAFYERAAGTRPALYRGIGSFPNTRTTLPRLMLDNDTATYYTSALSQGPGDWIGVDLGSVQDIDEVLVHQGRNSVDDVDYFDNVILETSADGKTWAALTEPLKNTYVVSWQGPAVKGRYVRLRRLDSERKNWASVRTFRVNPASLRRIGLNIEAADPEASILAFDANPVTGYNLAGTLGFDRKPEAKTLTVLTAPGQENITVKQLDKNGNAVAQTAMHGTYGRIVLDPQTTRIAIEGSGRIQEIIQR